MTYPACFDFCAADLDRAPGDVWPSGGGSGDGRVGARMRMRLEAAGLTPAMYGAAFEVGRAHCERGDRGAELADADVRPHGFESVADFGRAYVLCHAFHIASIRQQDATFASVRELLGMYCALAPPRTDVELPVRGGNLVEFLSRFDVRQLLAVGW
jgi:hypothetical protein